ncbi:adenylate/guanylate cyclase domain-containing protein [Microvirga calopogonii]|uniref:adenylate/guanylate cyclase domain-containing protein n=1 Tax=Microvirga calopogonii TaxID=2078013 RepID=UPI0013B3CB82|nr:adenylate/guanylate cyclase domain-containing protein [Microvirga calopogonii]
MTNPADPKVQRRLAAILAADVVGFSALMGQDEEGTLARIRSLHREIFEPKICDHRGRVVKTTGDGTLVEFSSPVEAVRCAVEVQETLSTRAFQDASQTLHLRIGINLGDIIIEDDGDIYGDGVNVAARLEQMAEPGSIWVSGKVYEEVRDKLPYSFEDRGEQQVKNIVRPLRVYSLLGGAVDLKAKVQVGQGDSLRGRPSIAVLPFTNISGDPEQDYFAEGLMEDIITELSRFRELAVAARSASFAFRGKSVNLPAIRRELNVHYLLEGSVRKIGSRLRLTAQLVDTLTGADVWAERYDEEMGRIFDVQDEIVAKIVSTLSGRIKSDVTERAKRKSPPNWEAFDCFLLGMEAFTSPRTRENQLRAVEFFQRAIGIDPNYARAHGKLAASYTVLARLTRGDAEARARALAAAQDWAQKGVSLDRDDASSLLALGYALLYERRFAEGEHYIDRAVALNPHDDQMGLHHVSALSYLGKAEQAVEKVERVLRHNPRWAVALFDLGIAHVFARNHEAAVAIFDQVPVHEERRLVVATYAHAGRIEQATHHAQLYVEEVRASWIGTPTTDVGELVRWDMMYNCPFKCREDTAYFCEGLRLAGLLE